MRRIAEAFLAACHAELEALKPGNVHRRASGHGMTVEDFRRSAEAAAPAVARPGAGVGERVLAAVAATRAAVGQNTNLGIVLICAPIAVAAERAGDEAAFWPALAAVLAGLSVADASLAYRAIRLAAPGGLGNAAAADVAEEPRCTLLEAMRLAADRDRIAWNYAHGFADLRQLGLPTYRGLGGEAGDPWSVTGLFLAYLGSLPDSHVVRKQGLAAADRLLARAGMLRRALPPLADPAFEQRLLTLDAELKAAGVNPGTSADLTVATVMIERLLRP